jgi:hypothetical protein
MPDTLLCWQERREFPTNVFVTLPTGEDIHVVSATRGHTRKGGRDVEGLYAEGSPATGWTVADPDAIRIVDLTHDPSDEAFAPDDEGSDA